MARLVKRNGMNSVARDAGVSIATVSRVINGKDTVSEKTYKRVLASIDKLGYVPDAHFRRMARQQSMDSLWTGNIGLLLQTIGQSKFVSDPYYARLFWSIEQQASTLGNHLIVTSIDSSSDHYLPRFVMDMHVDGVLVVGAFDEKFVRRISDKLPVVLLNIVADSLACPSIIPDEYLAVDRCLTYLRDLGHENILFFGIDDAFLNRVTSHHRRRVEAFEKLTNDDKTPLRQARLVILHGRDKPLLDVAVDMLSEWSREGTMPTAILCAADVYALAFLEAAEKMGIDIPGSLSVIGIDDTVFCEYARPKLTSIRQPLEEMGQTAVNMLLAMIRDPDNRPCSVQQRFDVTLIERDSCGPNNIK